MEIAAGVVSQVAAAALGSAVRLIDPFKYKRKVENLDFKLHQLRAARDYVQHFVDAARREGELIDTRVEHWLHRVDMIIEKLASERIEDEERAEKKCFAGLFPDCKSRYQLSKKVDLEAAAVAELLEASEFNRISAPPRTTGRGYVALQSRLPVFKEIMEALTVAGVNVVGVYGMGGVGKTTLVKQVGRQAIEERLFDTVVMACVGQRPDISKIQGQIADSLSLKCEDETEWGRAARLHERLKREKKILVVLDDLWDKLDLKAVGIPSKVEHEGCKVLLTSRSLDVLSFEMDSQMNFAVGVLTEDEAWELFEKTVGGNIDNLGVRSIAMEIAKECAGLPVAIVTVARALKGRELSQWEDALQELRRPSSTDTQTLPSLVMSALELSYNHLESEELKSTFLLCSLMRHKASIDNLLKYGVGLSLFPEVVSLEDARDRIRTLVFELKASSLLAEGDTAEQFAMHDLVGDVAVSIASRDHHVFTANNEIELDLLDRDAQKNVMQIWVDGDVNELPDMLECPLLEVLQIFSDDPYLIPDHFFEGMRELKVLYLSNLSFTFLPSSLHLLKNLRSLCLHESALGEIAIIGELRSLEILSFVKSSIKYLPKEVRQLTNLKLLDLSDCSELEVIPSNVISRLTLLEELYMGNSFHHWDVEGGSNASLAELACLSHLTSFHLHIQDSHVMSNDIFFERLQRFKIFIGDVWDWDGAYDALTTLKLKLNRSTDILKHGVQVLLKKTEDLHLLELKGVKNIIHELDREGFPKLKCLHLHNSPDIQYIINTLEWIPFDAFPMLESLILFNLPSLEKVCHGPFRAIPFERLGIIEVENCEKLKNLFSFNVARCLSQLVKIRIAYCPKMEEIVVEESREFDSKNEAIDVIEFSQLCTLTLQNLPCLRNFCSKVKTSCLSQTQSKLLLTDGQSEEIISEDELNTPMQLFNEKIVFPNLEELNLYSINTEKLWHCQHPAISFCIQHLQRLVVNHCSGLKHLFPSSMIKSLVQLKYLSVTSCMSVEEITVIEGLDGEETMTAVFFPNLEYMELSDLPKLTQFCTGSLIECPLLKQLIIRACPEFKTFISSMASANLTFSNEPQEVNLEENDHIVIQSFFDEKVVFPSLAEIEIFNVDKLEKIWHNQLAAVSFCELSSIRIRGCKRLVNIFPEILLRRFRRLEVLEIKFCHLIEAIFEVQEPSVVETHPFCSLQLRDLSLHSLPKLKHIWNKDPKGELHFQNLHVVRAFNCDVLKNLFPVSIARDLLQLEKLEIVHCGLEEIVAKEEDDEATLYFMFPQLSSLKLTDLHEFRNFYPGKHTWKCPMLTSLALSCCGNASLFSSEFLSFQEAQGKVHLNDPSQSLFFVEEMVSDLEELTLSGEDTATSIVWRCQLPAKFHRMLKVLKLQNFYAKSDPIPLVFLQRLGSLETLAVESSFLKKLFLFQGRVDKDKHGGMLPRLKKLIIRSVDDIRQIWEQEHWLIPILEKLCTLELHSCNNLVNLAPSTSTASFQNLTTLAIHNCNGLLNLITPSTAKSLVKLVKLIVVSCKSVTEIVEKLGDEIKDEIIFSKLEYLELVRLENLTSFCPGSYTFRLPSLKEMIMDQCPKMRFFSSGVLSTPKLQGVCWKRYSNNAKSWYGNLNSTIRQLHAEMVGFNGVQSLKLSDFPLLKERWHDQLPLNFISELRNLTVDGCEFVSNAMPPNLLQFMNSLEELNVMNCDSLEGLFGLVGLEGHVSLLPSLAELHLIELPNLGHICNNNPPGILNFKKLKFLEVQNCSSLRNIFTTSIALSLVQLQMIKVRNCTIMEEIIAKGEAEAEEASLYGIIFPVLEVIILDSLPNLTSIYPGSGILGFPSLEKISIGNCPNMKKFVSLFLREDESDLVNEGKELGLSKEPLAFSAAPILNHKVAFPNLSQLRVEWNDILEVIEHGQFRVEFFCKLKVLELIHFPNDYVAFPSYFLQRFTNLEELLVGDAFFEEIILDEAMNGEEKQTEGLAKLRKLKLSKLPKLIHLSKEDLLPCRIFQNLEILKVLECGRLKILVPSSISFHCLTTLVVSKCHGLIKLMTFSTAKSLVQLTRMSVSACEMIEEIVATEDNEIGDEVIFHKLKFLRLDCLPSLESFHLGNCTFLFPSLEEVHMKECPKMKNFSQGVVHTPKLQKVTMKEFGDNIWWDDNLNSTIQKLFMETGGEGASFNAPSLPEQHTLTYETLQEDKNALHAGSEGETSENLHIPENTDATRDFPPGVETIFKNKEHGVKSESEITELASKYQNFCAPSSSDKEGISSTPMDSEAHSKSQQPLTCQVSHATSNDKDEISNHVTPSFTLQQINNIPISPAAPAEQVSMLTFAFPADTTFSQELTTSSASKIPSIPITEMPSHPTANFEHLHASMEKLMKTCPEPSSQLVSSSNSDTEFRKSSGGSFDAYNYSIALIKRLLAKSPAELAISADCFLFLSSLKNLRNCYLLNAQQLEAIQLYIENFDTLVTSRPFYEQKIDWASAIKCSIEDERKGIVELKSSYEELSSKISMLSAEKEASKKGICEIEEEVDHIRANMEDLCNQLVIRKEKLETQMNALVEFLRQQRITEDRANNVDDCWAKFRSLFA